MENIKFYSVNFKNEELKKTAELLIASGFRVYTSNSSPSSSNTSYIYYEENNKIAYAQAQYWGISVSTSHRSERGSGFGTGFGLTEDAASNLTLEELRSGFIVAPKWVHGDFKKITKYKGMKDYISHNPILTYVEIV